MKMVFLAFSIVLSFSISWAQERPSNPGTDPLEAMKQDGGGTNALGVTGAICANCIKNSWNGARDANTNPAPKGSGSTDDGSSSGTSGTR